MIVYLENKLRFVVSYRYVLRPNVTSSVAPYKVKKQFTKENMYYIRDFISMCNATMIGFVQDQSIEGTFENHPITCFWAEKDPKQIYEK